MKKTKAFLTYLLLGIITLISLYPFYTMIIMATYRSENLFQQIPILPGNYFLENLKVVMSANFAQTYVNSLLIAVISTVVSVLVSGMIGYGINVYQFRLKKIIVSFIMLTMMVPTQISIIGYMIEMRKMGFQDSLWPMIFVWFAHGFGAFWMIQFIQTSVPMEIIESARIDGSGEFSTFLKIAFPCIKPAVTTLSLLVFLGSWNSYLYPLVFSNREELYTIPIFIKSLSNMYRTDYGAQLVGLSLSIVPVVILFVICSKTFIKGLTAGAVKG